MSIFCALQMFEDEHTLSRMYGFANRLGGGRRRRLAMTRRLFYGIDSVPQ